MDSQEIEKNIIGKNMKIGILTFHYAKNYGAVLQCWALKSYLESQGHEVSVIDYRSKAIKAEYRLFDIRRYIARDPLRMFRKSVNEIKTLKARKSRYESFEQFICSELNLKLPGTEKYDLVIIGSDQVWNTELTEGFDQYYWAGKDAMKDLLNPGGKVISYAASVGEGLFTHDRNSLPDALERFDGISLRESTYSRSIESLYSRGKSVEVCCDPTLLMDGEEWIRLGGEPNSRKGYVFLYQVGDATHLQECAKDWADSHGLPLKLLSAKMENGSDKDIEASSPLDFIRLAAGADAIITNSFHGTVFSLLLEKQFISVRNGDSKDARLKNILKETGLLGHLVRLEDGSNTALEVPEAIDWASVRDKVDALRKISVEYLDKYTRR